jgi:hypothetical protein
MDEELQTVSTPRSPLYRVGRAPNPFSLPPWAFVGADGTLGGRFDDPRGRDGLPPSLRFRVLYLATESAGAFGESIARFRPDLDVLSGAPPHVATSSRLERPAVSAGWRLARRLGVTVLDRRLTIADIFAPESIQVLREALAPLAVALRLPDIDVSALCGPQRRLTHEIARYIYEQTDKGGRPLYSGLRYLSHYNTDWECWALFADRLSHRVLRADPIPATTPGLIDAARILRLRIEEDGGGRYITP